MTAEEMIRYMEKEGAIEIPLASEIRHHMNLMEWEPVPEELYDGTSFKDFPPVMFGPRYPVVLFNSYLWIYTPNSYFKFTPCIP